MSPHQPAEDPSSWSPPAAHLGAELAEPTSAERGWGSAAHWSSLVAAWCALAFLGPLLVLLLKGRDSAWVRRQAVESLNFQLSMLIYTAVGGVLAFLLLALTVGLGILVVLPVGVAFGTFWLVFTLIGALSATRDGAWRYPLTLRLVS